MKEKILKTAGELFFKYGLRSVSIDDICNELHISKKTFYIHFKQKDELIEALICEVYKKRSEDLDSIVHCENIIDSLMSNFKVVLQNMVVQKHIVFFFDLNKYYPEISEKYKDTMAQVELENNKMILKVGIEQKLFREDIHIDAMALFLSSQFLSTYSRLSKSKLTNAQKVDFIFDAFFRLIANEEGLKYYLSKK